MDNLSIIGIDVSKSSFQVHCATASGEPVLRKKLSRGKVVEFLEVALANKMARIIWALIVKDESYRAPKVLGAVAG